MSERIEQYRHQIALARTEIKNLRQQLSALKHEHQKDVKLLKATINNLSCSSCGDAATTITSNAPSTSSVNDSIQFKPIGIIETSFQNKRAVPRQPSVLATAKGTIVIDQRVFSNPKHALDGLEEFSHMWIIFFFHNTESTNAPAKVAPPRLGGERRGVFSTRSPHRPCPIGLSLVKIDGIEGNKVHFLGVDMVTGTPVLDIKPYIPQYDYPSPSFSDALLVRPPTVGSLQINDDGMGSASPRIPPPIGIDSIPSRAPYEDMPSPGAQNIITPMSPSPDSPSSVDLIDGNLSRTPSRRPDYERGAPDGQERFTPPQSAQVVSLTEDGIRVAPWISNPPTQTYQVRFTNDVARRIDELIGDRAASFKRNVESLLADDPRSHYVRARYPDHEYSCVLEDLSLSCVFDADLSVCTIVAVRSADELQQS